MPNLRELEARQVKSMDYFLEKELLARLPQLKFEYSKVTVYYCDVFECM